MSGFGPNVTPLRSRRILTGDAHMGAHKAPEWLVDGIIQCSRLYALTSLTAHGKTAVALYIACMIHAHRMVGQLDVFGGNVLYLAGENPDDLAARMLGMAHHFKIPSLRMPYVLPHAFPLDQAGVDQLKDDIADLGISLALIVGDTAASFFFGDDENNNVQAGAQARLWRQLTEVDGNPAVMPLCHPTKGARDHESLLPRGGGAFLNELDANLTLWSSALGEQTTLHWNGKIRGPDFAPLDFRLLQVSTGTQDSKGRDVATVVAMPIDEGEVADRNRQNVANEDALLRSFHEHPDWSRAQRARDLNWLDGDGEPERWRVGRVANELVKQGLLKQERKGEPYVVTDKGERALNRRWPGTI